MSNRLHARLAPAAIALLLGGCAVQLQPVADFGAAASRVAASYKPFGAGIAASCEQRERYVALGGAGAFDDAVSQRAAAAKCAPLKEAGATAALFGQALSDYASALAKASGAKPTAFDGEIKSISSAAAALANKDGTPVFDSTKVSAASRIARAAAALALEGRQQVLTRETLRDNADALKTVVDAMKSYAGGVYAGQLADTHDIMAGELQRLVAASNAPTQGDVEAKLPWRFAQASVRADIAANELEARHARDFGKTADALLAAHAELIADFDKIGGARRLELVAAFVDEVKALNDDAAAL